MNMFSKKIARMHYIILTILAFIPLVMTAIAFPFLPDPLPAHFSFSGSVTRWGSVYEAFLLPVIALVLGLFMIWATKFSERKDDYAGKMVFWTTIVMHAIFIAINAALLYVWATY